MKKLSIITVNFNQPQATLELLRSIDLLKQYGDAEIIVVDNGSITNATKELSFEFPEVTYIRSEKNLGFAGGNNLGVEKASGDYLFFVNNDTEFTAGLIEKLIALLESKPLAGIVCPKIIYYAQQNTIQYAGFTKMNFYTGRNKCIGQLETDYGQYGSTSYRTEFAHGAAMMLRRSAIEKAGSMPENYFLYYEEMEWCESIKKYGYEIWIDPSAVIYHKESLSTGQNSPMKEYFMTRNRILFIRRNATPLTVIIFHLYFYTLVLPRNLYRYLAANRIDLAKAFFKGIWWNITHQKDSLNR
ncbi:MAG: glycosyltransferase family 2 protein [Bacteroidota bacterium]